jgi:HPt (histidine-containing phosphotransfer) domain-containing protein
MATLVDQEFQARLAALGAKFAATVPVTMGKISAALAACDAETTPSAATLTELQELLHGVAGSAGTFGFGELGQQCRRIEQALRVVIMAQNFSPSEWQPIRQEVKRLLAWAEIDLKSPWPESH